MNNSRSLKIWLKKHEEAKCLQAKCLDHNSSHQPQQQFVRETQDLLTGHSEGFGYTTSYKVETQSDSFTWELKLQNGFPKCSSTFHLRKQNTKYLNSPTNRWYLATCCIYDCCFNNLPPICQTTPGIDRLITSQSAFFKDVAAGDFDPPPKKPKNKRMLYCSVIFTCCLKILMPNQQLKNVLHKTQIMFGVLPLQSNVISCLLYWLSLLMCQWCFNFLYFLDYTNNNIGTTLLI